MKILLVAAMAAALSSSGPTPAQFGAALAAACPAPPTVVRNIGCRRVEEGSIQFACRYQMQGPDGRWSAHEAILQQAEGEWVWIDGPTRCGDEEEPSLN